MATVGVSKPMYAKYSNTDDKVSYSEGGVFAKAVEFSATIESSEANNLYADNGVAESDVSFSSGELSVTTDDISQDATSMMLGITPKPITVGSKEVQELVYDDDMVAPDMGFGIVIKKIKNGITKWRAIVFHKIKFNIPEDAATTQGETIEWQTPTVTATIMRDDSEKHGWKSEATLDSESLAMEYIKTKLGITQPTEKVESKNE